MPDPYATPTDLREAFGALDVDAYVAQGATDPDAYWTRRIEEGDRYLDDLLECAGRARPPAADVDRPDGMKTRLRFHATTVALKFGVGASDTLRKGIEIRWKILEEWLRCGAPMGDGSASELVTAISLAPEDACPAIPPSVWNELTPCAAAPCYREAD